MTRLVYILAASHSGSTLTAMLLGAHPQVCTVGELKWTSLGDIERYRCSCGEPIAACGFWRDIQRGMARRGFAFDLAGTRTDLQSMATPFERRLLAPLHRGRLLELARDAALHLSPSWPRHRDEFRARNQALAASVLERTGKDVIVDSSKIALRLKYLLGARELDVRVIRVIRDGRAVALTYTDPATYADASNPRLTGGGSGASRDHQRLSMADAAREWRRSNEEAEALLRRLDPSRWTSVRYEDLCAAPARELRRLFAFIGVDPASARLDFRSGEHHVVGNGMRLDASSEIRLDERWREALGGRELQTFAAVAGPLNHRLGYA